MSKFIRASSLYLVASAMLLGCGKPPADPKSLEGNWMEVRREYDYRDGKGAHKGTDNLVEGDAPIYRFANGKMLQLKAATPTSEASPTPVSERAEVIKEASYQLTGNELTIATGPQAQRFQISELTDSELKLTEELQGQTSGSRRIYFKRMDGTSEVAQTPKANLPGAPTVPTTSPESALKRN